MQALTLKHVSVTRGDRCIVSGLGFSVAAGEALHLRGANGTGKTSLLEVLAGLRPQGEGEIKGGPERESLHYLGVRNALSPGLSPLQNLEFWCGLNDAPLAAIAPALKQLSIWPLRHRACRSLSTGQRRRVALARLLLVSRPWWFLDEPVNGLDEAGERCFVALLESHLAQGGAAVIASHQALVLPQAPVRQLSLS